MSKIDIFPYPTPIPAKIRGCSLWSRSVTLESAERKMVRLIIREIIFEEFKPIWSWIHDTSTDGQTDGQLALAKPAIYSEPSTFTSKVTFIILCYVP